MTARFTHRVNEVCRCQPARDSAVKLSRFPARAAAVGSSGVKVMDPHLGVDFLEQLGFPGTACRIKSSAPIPDQLLAVVVHRGTWAVTAMNPGVLATGHGPDPVADRLMAVHHRHAEIHQDQMWAALFLKLLDGFRSVGRQPDLETDGA